MAKKALPLDNLPQVAARLKKARLDAGKTQTDVADAIGLSQPYIQRYESGTTEPPLAVLVKMAEIYAVRIDWFLTGAASSTEQQAVANGNAPHGYDMVRLPRGDPRPMSAQEADCLEKALAVLRGTGEAEHFSISLAQTIESSFKGLLTAQKIEATSEPSHGKKSAG